MRPFPSTEKYIGNAVRRFSFSLFNEVGIKALGSGCGCVTQLLAHGDNIRTVGNQHRCDSVPECML